MDRELGMTTLVPKRADQELVERARSGDQEAFSELVRAHRALAYGWANKISRDMVSLLRL